MSARVLSRERGCVITCNEGDLEEGVVEDCSAAFTTALILVKNNVVAAVNAGWFRGGGSQLGGSSKRFTFCPEHAGAERERMRDFAEAKAKRRAERDAKRAAARQPSTEPSTGGNDGASGVTKAPRRRRVPAQARTDT